MSAPSDIEARVRAALAASDLPYNAIEIDPQYADTAAFCAQYGVALERSGNCIVVASKKPAGKYAACVLLATTRLDVNRAVRHRMGVGRVSFAAPEETRLLTGMEIGGVTPLALPPDLPIYVDSRVMTVERVVLGGGSRSLKVDVSPSIFERLPNAVEVIDELAVEPATKL